MGRVLFSGQVGSVGASDLERGTSPWNARYKHLAKTDAATLEDPRIAAGAYVVDGVFNVNSTSAAAWMALLAGASGLPFDPVTGTAGSALPPSVSRFVRPTEGSGNSTEERWNGFRALEASELRALAEAIVREVKERGPFLTLADFVNRRLVAGDTEEGLFGALEAAIRSSGINSPLAAEGGALAFGDLPPDLREQPNEIDALIEGDFYEGIPKWIIQEDLLQRLAPLLLSSGWWGCIRPGRGYRRHDNRNRSTKRVFLQPFVRDARRSDFRRCPGYPASRSRRLDGEKRAPVLPSACGGAGSGSAGGVFLEIPAAGGSTTHSDGKRQTRRKRRSGSVQFASFLERVSEDDSGTEESQSTLEPGM